MTAALVAKDVFEKRSKRRAPPVLRVSRPGRRPGLTAAASVTGR